MFILLSTVFIITENYFYSEEDEFGKFAQIILKHYLAEGVLSEHSLVFASPELEAKKFVRILSSLIYIFPKPVEIR